MIEINLLPEEGKSSKTIKNAPSLSKMAELEARVSEFYRSIAADPSDLYSYVKIGHEYIKHGDKAEGERLIRIAREGFKHMAKIAAGGGIPPGMPKTYEALVRELVEHSEDEEEKADVLFSAAHAFDPSIVFSGRALDVYKQPISDIKKTTVLEEALRRSYLRSGHKKMDHFQYVKFCVGKPELMLTAIAFYSEMASVNPREFAPYLIVLQKRAGVPQTDMPKPQAAGQALPSSIVEVAGTSLSPLGNLLFGDELNKDFLEKFDRADFMKHVEGFDSMAKEPHFDPSRAVEYALFLTRSIMVPEDISDLIQKRIDELIAQDPSNSALYFIRANYNFALGKEKKIGDYLIAYEDPWFSPHSLDFKREAHSFFRAISEEYGRSGNPGKAAIAMLRDLNSDPQSKIVGFANELFEFLRSGGIKDFGASVKLAEKIDSAYEIVGCYIIANSAAKTGKFSEAAAAQRRVTTGRHFWSDPFTPFSNLLEDIERSLNSECRFLLARSMYLLGDYDGAAEVLESMPGKGAVEYALLGETYECWWRLENEKRTGKRGLLEKAHDYYAKAWTMDKQNAEYAACTAMAARMLRRKDEVAGIFLYARKFFKDEPARVEQIKRRVGNSLDIRAALAYESDDIGARIAALSAIAIEHPDEIRYHLIDESRQYIKDVVEAVGEELSP